MDTPAAKLSSLVIAGCIAIAPQRSAPKERRRRQPTTRQIVEVIRELNPQARKRGWRWRYEHPRYYRPEQLRRYAGWILRCAKRYKQNPWYVVAILQEQSRFHYNAVSKTQDFGMSQIHCPSQWCRFPPTRRQRRKLFSAQWSIDTLGQWLVQKQALCGRSQKGSRLYRRCQRNRQITGVVGTLGHPHKTRRLLDRIRTIRRQLATR